MALTSTLYRFQIDVSDIDRSVYEGLDLRVACHPSEELERMVVRVLGRAIANEDNLKFGRGLSHTEDPALSIQSHHGDVECWIDIGLPSAERLHRASKKAERVIVFTDKETGPLKKEWSSRKIHKSETIIIIRLAPEMTRGLASCLERNTQWYMTIQDGELSVACKDDCFESPLKRESLSTFLTQ